jgi:Tat protein secretion system quality control protein TatD with DNase activity
MEELFQHPRIEEHFAGRESDRLAIDAVLADLNAIGEVGLDVHREHGDTLYTCTLVLRTGEGSVVVTAESSLAAALGCLLETLLELHDHTRDGLADLEDFLGSV